MHGEVRAFIDRCKELAELKGCQCALVVPVKPLSKSPIVHHKGGAWTAETSNAWFKAHDSKKYRVGLLLYNLIIVDFDAKEDKDKRMLEHGCVEYERWLKRFPEFEGAPTERTKKGIHVYFFRSQALEDAGITDGPLIDSATQKRCCIDIKTRTSSVHNGQYTGGLVVCAPTPGYEWLEGKSIFELEPPEPSQKLIRYIKARTVAGKTPPTPRARAPPRAPTGAREHTPLAAILSAPNAEAPTMDVAGVARRRDDASIQLQTIESADAHDILMCFSARHGVEMLAPSFKHEARHIYDAL